jgi:hypothetical protein
MARFCSICSLNLAEFSDRLLEQHWLQERLSLKKTVDLRIALYLSEKSAFDSLDIG